MISECEVKRLGDLPFLYNEFATCGTFLIDRSPTIILCPFDDKCLSLTRKNHDALSGIRNFFFDSQFDVDKNAIPNSTYNHGGASLANYKGFPLILGGAHVDSSNNKLEMLNTMESPFRWLEGIDYPFLTKLVVCHNL